MMIDTRNAHEAFICQNISKQLLADGYPPLEVKRATTEALRFYRSTAKFHQGKVFDACLSRAKSMLAPLKKATTNSKKKRG
ncbi:MAG: hypothetical protein ACK5MF_15425 [Vibrio sp.]|uniref:hypothetical protein n=1 Tax=Vibrio sp. TaxID=678 RepID=UPI003A8B198C